MIKKVTGILALIVTISTVGMELPQALPVQRIKRPLEGKFEPESKLQKTDILALDQRLASLPAEHRLIELESLLQRAHPFPFWYVKKGRMDFVYPPVRMMEFADIWAELRWLYEKQLLNADAYHSDALKKVLFSFARKYEDVLGVPSLIADIIMNRHMPRPVIRELVQNANDQTIFNAFYILVTQAATIDELYNNIGTLIEAGANPYVQDGLGRNIISYIQEGLIAHPKGLKMDQLLRFLRRMYHPAPDISGYI